MDRRNFLRGSLAMGATLALSGKAWADETADAFHAGMRAHPRLAVLQGSNAEMLSGAAAIEGRWPSDLKGVFYRNGPARFELGGERYHHWFDGDGMVHAWHMEEGGVRHVSRFVRTRKYSEESAAGEFLYPTFATHIQRRGIRNIDTINTANTNAVPHAGKLYALWEAGSATELDPTDLGTRGIKTWRDDLGALPFSAHPKITPDGTLWNFGVMPGADRLLLWRVDSDGSLGKFGMLDIPQLNMVHDFVVTARYLVLLVPPFSFHGAEADNFLAMNRWDADRPLRAVVVDKSDFSLKRIIEMPTGMIFHFGNGWDDGRTIHLDCCLSRDASVLAQLGEAMRGELWHGAAEATSTLVSLDLTRGTARSEALLHSTEFPRVLPANVGMRHRAVYTLVGRGTTLGLSGVARIDIDSGRTDRYNFGDDWVVEEHVPVPKASGKGCWLVGPAYDVRRAQTVLNVFDGAHIAQGPVARARLAYAAPLCFHGNILVT